MEFLRFFYSFVWVRILVCYWNHCRVTINYKALWVFSGMPQQYLNKELGYELELWTWFIEKNVDAVMLGKNTFVLAFFLPLKLVWGGSFSYNLFTKNSTYEEDQQNQKLFFHLIFGISIPSFHYWVVYIKKSIFYRKRRCNWEKRKKKGSLVLVSIT